MLESSHQEMSYASNNTAAKTDCQPSDLTKLYPAHMTKQTE